MLVVDNINKYTTATDTTISSNTVNSNHITYYKNLTINSGVILSLSYYGTSLIYVSGDLSVNGSIIKIGGASASNWDGATDGSRQYGGIACTDLASMTYTDWITKNGILATGSYLEYRFLENWGSSGRGDGTSYGNGCGAAVFIVNGKVTFGSAGIIQANGVDGTGDGAGGGGGGAIVIYAGNGIYAYDISTLHLQSIGGRGGDTVTGGKSGEGKHGGPGGGGGLIALISSGTSMASHNPNTPYVGTNNISVSAGDKGNDYSGTEPYVSCNGAGGGSFGAGGDADGTLAEDGLLRELELIGRHL